MKVAFCFIISYDHKINKEQLWKDWIEPNKDIVNVYFHYKDYEKIQSEWIREHTIPKKNLFNTSYYHIVPAIMSLFAYAAYEDTENQWFCLVTESCVPIISPQKFRKLFNNYADQSIIKCSKAWWNPKFHKRANLRHFSEDFHLGNEPWFILCKEDVKMCMHFVEKEREKFNFICKGGLANESIFAMIFKFYDKLGRVNNHVTHLTDWSRMTSATSPHLFKDGDERDIEFIEEKLSSEPFAMFLRKVSAKFPDDILMKYIENTPDLPVEEEENDSEGEAENITDLAVHERFVFTDNDSDLGEIDNNYIRREIDKLGWQIEMGFVLYVLRFISIVIFLNAFYKMLEFVITEGDRTLVNMSSNYA